VDLTEEQLALQRAFASFFAGESTPERVRAAEPLGFDASLWQRVRELGVPSMGLDASLLDLAVVAEQAGRHLGSVPLVETLVATRLRGVDDDTLATIALRAGGRLVPAGAVADVVVALDGEELVEVRSPAPGVAAANLGSAPMADRDLHTGARTVLARGDEAHERFARALDEWRGLTAAALVGLAQGALDLGVAYVKERRQFGVPIGSFQAVQHRLADVATAVAGARLLAYEAARSAQPVVVSMAFLFAAEAAQEAAAASLHVHGGYGFTLEYDAQLFFRRAKAWALAAGDPRRERLRIADLGFVTEPPPDPHRDEVRAFLAEHLTPDVIERVHATGTVHDWGFHRALAAEGWLNGQGRDPVLVDELTRARAPMDGAGTAVLVARTLERVGTDAQRAEVVPRIYAGEILVCLGYSEPDSGSDVAAAKTRAQRDGDEWVINGQKMFTTLAHESAYVFLLTRTGTGPAKHRGLTMFLVAMDSPGIEVRAMQTLGGERTNVTFYNDVRVPDSARVGEVDGGWDVMAVALAFERQPVANGETRRLFERTLAWARHTGAIDDPIARDRLARVAVDVEVGRLLGDRLASLAMKGELPVVEGSMAKLFASEAFQRAAADLLDLTGAEGALQHGEPGASAEGWVEHAYRHAAVTTIYAGVSEIQRSIIAERGLGLPRSR
jgi:alkylation response protein AidB-like acyl-CoA dehydrogenase